MGNASCCRRRREIAIRGQAGHVWFIGRGRTSRHSDLTVFADAMKGCALMDFGVICQPGPGIRPDTFAQTVEEYGFESVWFGEHTHIPVHRGPEYPDYPSKGQLAPMYR